MTVDRMGSARDERDALLIFLNRRKGKIGAENFFAFCLFFPIDTTGKNMIKCCRKPRVGECRSGENPINTRAKRPKEKRDET